MSYSVSETHFCRAKVEKCVSDTLFEDQGYFVLETILAMQLSRQLPSHLPLTHFQPSSTTVYGRQRCLSSTNGCPSFSCLNVRPSTTTLCLKYHSEYLPAFICKKARNLTRSMNLALLLTSRSRRYTSFSWVCRSRKIQTT